ncbi:MAG TPA: DUF624 domain-containing protein [Aggregatilineales bacterium]|nr:DUF624 domain-containing protein [Aggregatilineales bacterium]
MQQLSSAFTVIKQAAAHWAADWLKLTLINGLWALSMVTVILAPPAVLALTAVARDRVQRESVTVRAYFGYLKEYFFTGWRWGLFNVVFGLIVYANFRFYDEMIAGFPLVPYAILLALVIFWISLQFMAVVYLVWQDDRHVLKALRYSLFTIGASPIFVLILLVPVGLIGLFAIYFNGIPLVLTASFIALLSAQAVQNRLRTFGATHRGATHGGATQPDAVEPDAVEPSVTD